MRKLGLERRLYPRIDQTLPLKIAANGYNITTNTTNISCIGAYCHIDKYIPPFTKIAVKMTLPLKSEDNQKSVIVECKGVIVRADDDNENKGFNVAIFFNEIKEAQKQKILRYINQILPAQTLHINTIASLQ